VTTERKRELKKKYKMNSQRRENKEAVRFRLVQKKFGSFNARKKKMRGGSAKLIWGEKQCCENWISKSASL